jgi:hypothetical protein
VARHETTVSELIKNSYYADTTNALLHFLNVDKVGGKLVIEDDGNGMTRAEVTDGFIRISSTSKIHEPISPVYKKKQSSRNAPSNRVYC